MSLQEEINRLKEEKEALRAEYNSPDNIDGPNSPTTPPAIHRQLNMLVPEAINQLERLVNHAESESVRFQVSKYLVDIARNPTDPNNPESALSSLLNELRKTPAP